MGGRRKKTILFANKTMRTKDGRHFALTSIYLVVIITAKREKKRERAARKVDFLPLSLFFSLGASLFLLADFLLAGTRSNNDE